jgi:hypothetical protein
VGKVLDTLDHPLVFLFFMLLALQGLKMGMKSIASKMGWNGIAAFFQ